MPFRNYSKNPVNLLISRLTGLIRYSHSMVAGGLDVISKTTRFTPFTSLTPGSIPFQGLRKGFGPLSGHKVPGGNGTESHCIIVGPSILFTPTLLIPVKTAKYWFMDLFKPAFSNSSLKIWSASRRISSFSKLFHQ